MEEEIIRMGWCRRRRRWKSPGGTWSSARRSSRRTRRSRGGRTGGGRRSWSRRGKDHSHGSLSVLTQCAVGCNDLNNLMIQTLG